MQLSNRQELVLKGVLRNQQDLMHLPVSGDLGLQREQLGRRRIQVRNAQSGLVPMNLAGWIGHTPSNSECVLYHREYLRLEGMGLLVRCNFYGGRRTSHLKLTTAGRIVAERLLAEEGRPSEDDIYKMIDWSTLEIPADAAAPQPQEVEHDAQ